MAFSLTKIDPAGRITITPGVGYYDVRYQMGCRNINTIALRLNYTRDVADLTIQPSYKDIRFDPAAVVPTIANNNDFDETFIDGTGKVQKNAIILDAGTGKYRLLFNPLRCEGEITFRITPTSLVGNDALVVDINEDALGA